LGEDTGNLTRKKEEKTRKNKKQQKKKRVANWKTTNYKNLTGSQL